MLCLVTTLLYGQPEVDGKDADMKAQMAFIDGERHMILENYAKALEMFQTAREINPDEPAVHFKIAQVLYQNKEFDKALTSIEKALDLDDENKFYYILAADIEYGRSDLGSAQKHYEELLKMPGTEDYLSELALLYQYQGKYKKALETYERVQDHFGTNEGIVQEKQKIFVAMGEPDLAIADWERLVEENPGDDQYVFDLVNRLLFANQNEKAAEQLRTLLDADPNNARASLMMAEVMKNSGNTEDAAKYAGGSLLSSDVEFNFKGGVLNDLLKSTDAENSDEFQQLVKDVAAVHSDEYTAQAFAGDVFFQLDNKQDAIAYYLRATRINPDNFSVWQNILSMESEHQMWDSLIVHAEEAIELFPNQGALYYFGGTGYLRKKNYQRSVGLLEMGKRYALDDRLLSVFNGQLGDAYNGMKNYSKSDAAYESALKIDPANEHVLNNYSFQLSLRKSKLEKALEMSSELIKIKPNVSTYMDTHGWVLFALGKYKESKKYLEKAAATSNSAAVTEHYGDVLFKLGMENEAMAQWEKAASLGDASALLLKKIADKKYYE